MNSESIIQFVCFETPLPRLAFVPLWRPVATSYLDDGLRRITLRHRVQPSLAGDAPEYISRNEWPKAAFVSVLAKGRIGEGGGWPVKANQGGSFLDTGMAELAANEDPIAMALLKLPRSPQDVDSVVRVLERLRARYALYSDVVPDAPARFNVIAELRGQRDSRWGERLRDALMPLAAEGSLSLALYDQALILPTP